MNVHFGLTNIQFDYIIILNHFKNYKYKKINHIKDRAETNPKVAAFEFKVS